MKIKNIQQSTDACVCILNKNPKNEADIEYCNQIRVAFDVGLTLTLRGGIFLDFKNWVLSNEKVCITGATNNPNEITKELKELEPVGKWVLDLTQIPRVRKTEPNETELNAENPRVKNILKSWVKYIEECIKDLDDEARQKAIRDEVNNFDTFSVGFFKTEKFKKGVEEQVLLANQVIDVYECLKAFNN